MRLPVAVRRSAITITAALAIWPASASAFTLGNGYNPAVAMDAAGTAYIAWNGSADPNDNTSLHFCRLPRGAAACDLTTTLPAQGLTLHRPFVRVQGDRVDVVEFRYSLPSGPYDQIVAFTSSDGGATFGPGSMVGSVSFNEAVAGPGDSLTVAGPGGIVQDVPFAGPATPPGAQLFDGAQGVYGAVGLLDPGTPLALYSNGSSEAQFRRYSGSGSLGNPASWESPVSIGYADYPQLSSGSRGLFLLDAPRAGGLEVRRFDGTTFASAATIPQGDGISAAYLFQDAGGRLQAVWPRRELDGVHLYHAVSDDGVRWQSGSVLVQNDDGPGSLRAAAAADHVGVAVWRTRTSAGLGEVRAAAIGPDAPAGAAPPPPPDTVPTPTPTPAALPVAGVRVDTRVVSGRVSVRRSGKRSVPLGASTTSLPVGSVVDARNGQLELTSATGVGAGRASARVGGGVFRIRQARAGARQRTPVATDLQLVTPTAKASARCRARRPPAKGIVRGLTVAAKGLIRTTAGAGMITAKGASATWTTQDRCAGTFVRVTRGRVSVKATKGAHKRTTTVTAGHSRLLKARIFAIRKKPAKSARVGDGAGRARSAQVGDDDVIAAASYGAAEVWLQRASGGRRELRFTARSRAPERVLRISPPAGHWGDDLALGLDASGKLTVVLESSRGLYSAHTSGTPRATHVPGTTNDDRVPSLFRGHLAYGRYSAGTFVDSSTVRLGSLTSAAARTVWSSGDSSWSPTQIRLGADDAVAIVASREGAGNGAYQLQIAHPGATTQRLLYLPLGDTHDGHVAIVSMTAEGRRLKVERILDRALTDYTYTLPDGRKIREKTQLAGGS